MLSLLNMTTETVPSEFTVTSSAASDKILEAPDTVHDQETLDTSETRVAFSTGKVTSRARC